MVTHPQVSMIYPRLMDLKIGFYWGNPNAFSGLQILGVYPLNFSPYTALMYIYIYIYIYGR
jgi:hypothetical protein